MSQVAPYSFLAKYLGDRVKGRVMAQRVKAKGLAGLDLINEHILRHERSLQAQILGIFESSNNAPRYDNLFDGTTISLSNWRRAVDGLRNRRLSNLEVTVWDDYDGFSGGRCLMISTSTGRLHKLYYSDLM